MARNKRTGYPRGTVSSGTMRPEDLIPDFLYELRSNLRNYSVSRETRKAHFALLRDIEKRMTPNPATDDGDDYFDSEEAEYDLESLFDALGEYAGPYFYFGAHPGDGADYGYWISESFGEDFDGLRVADLSEVPTDYRGEVLEVNDHGNVTLYVKSARKFRYIWGIV